MTTSFNPEHLHSNSQEFHLFDVSSYLEERAKKDTFVMVEFGHDSLPVAYHQSRPLAGNRAYIGYEAWMRDHEGKKKSRLLERHSLYSGNSTNIHFQTLALGGMVRTVADENEESVERWFEGEYNPVTPLPDESVEEVLLGNVFGDPHISYAQSRTNALLSEATRIVDKDGVIVIRETITPHNSRTSEEDLARWPRMKTSLEASIEEQGLTVLSYTTPQDEGWQALENEFMSERYYNKGAYYLFLSKGANSQR
jgi:hypothetical protein